MPNSKSEPKRNPYLADALRKQQEKRKEASEGNKPSGNKAASSAATSSTADKE